MNTCDLLISAPWVLPVAPDNTVLDDHALAVSDGQIVALGLRATLEAQYQANERIALTDHILLPGLVNAHGHGAMSLLRGAGEDQPLKAWLEETIWPMEAALVNHEFVRLGTELAIAEMLLSGTTTFSDMYFLPEVVGEVAAEQGIRVQLAFPIIEFPNVWSENAEEAIHKGLALFNKFRHHERVNVAFGPHSAYSVSTADLERVGMYTAELEIPIHMHLHETAVEVADARASNGGNSWVEQLHAIGLLGPHFQAVHMTQLSDTELGLIADTGTEVVHCPTSNLKLASGYCPVTQLHQHGVTVGLGTDGAASNNRLDMFDEARLAALLAKHHEQDAAAGNAPDVLKMATYDGARVLGIEELTGSLEVGKQADFITVDSTALGMLPLYNPFAALIHGNAGNAVDNVFIGGEALVKDGQLTKLSLRELAQRVQTWHSARR